MKKTRYSESQIIKVLKEVQGGRTVKAVCREYGVAEGTDYTWKGKYGVFDRVGAWRGHPSKLRML